MKSYRDAFAEIRPPRHACQTQDYKAGFVDGKNGAFEFVAPIEMEMAMLRGLLREIVTAKDISMPIETDEKIRAMLDGSAKRTDADVLIEESDLLRNLGKAIAAEEKIEGALRCLDNAAFDAGAMAARKILRGEK